MSFPSLPALILHALASVSLVSVIGCGARTGLLEPAEPDASVSSSLCAAPGWSPMSTGHLGELPSLTGVWGTGPSDVFAVGWKGTILHYDGRSWARMNSSAVQDLYGVWGGSATDVWIVGSGGTILHYDGRSWTQQPAVPAANYLRGVWGFGPGNVFAADRNGNLIAYDGTAWRLQQAFLPDQHEPDQTTPKGFSTPLEAVWGRSPSDVYAVGGGVVHYDGRSWKKRKIDIHGLLDGAAVGKFNDVWGWEQGGMILVEEFGKIFLHDGNGWSYFNHGYDHVWRSHDYSFFGVWGSSPEDIFAVGAADADVTYVSSGEAFHFDGRDWEIMDTGVNGALFDIWGSGPNDVFAVGSAGTILHYCQP